jgi:hypothetical protein
MPSLRALPIPPFVATLLFQNDEACSLWIANCLVAELGADFQTHQLRSYRPRLYLRVNGPLHAKEYVPVLLCELPCAFDLHHSWKSDVWRELLKKFEAKVEIPGYLFGLLRRVESALEHFFLSVSTLSPASAEKPSAKADNVPPALAGILGSSSMQWLGKKVPEELLLHILRDLKVSSGYDVPLTEIAQRDLLAQIILSVCQEGAPTVIAVTQALTFLHLKPLGTCDGTIVSSEETWISLDRNSESFAVHTGSAVSKAAVVLDICELITHVKIVLNSYLVAYQVRRMLYPDEERVLGGSWLDLRSIQNFTDSMRKRDQSHPLARDDGAVNNDGHETGTKLVLFSVKIPFYQEDREDRDTVVPVTQCNELCIVTCTRLHLDGLRLHTPCLYASSP